MTDYTELVKALRCCGKDLMPGERCKDSCPYGDIALCLPKLKLDAAAAIEELQQKWFKSETDATNLTGKLAQAEADIDRLNLEIDKRIATEIELSNQVDALQAENPIVETVLVDKLRQRIDELEEKQTYCDAYGDKWMTSGKDVPTEAYKHGYADGWDEAMAKMEVQE